MRLANIRYRELHLSLGVPRHNSGVVNRLADYRVQLLFGQGSLVKRVCFDRHGAKSDIIMESAEVALPCGKFTGIVTATRPTGAAVRNIR